MSLERTFQVDFRPNPLQKQFIESRASADLFSSRVGEGKSTGLAWSIAYHTTHNPGANWVMVRDTWENLRRTTQKEFFKWFPPGIMGTYHAQNKEFTWAEGFAKGTVTFIGLDDQSDASKLQSLELAGFAIDEPAPAAQSGGVDELIFDIGLSRLRQPDMKWYAVKLAENNPDESHWTYRRFVDPGTDYMMDGGERIYFSVFQPNAPENEKHLPANYYAGIRALWAHRPDLIRRFVEGKFGFTAVGKAVTPEWSDEWHLAVGLAPLRGTDLLLCWDFGLNPTCLITQLTQQGNWNILEAHVGQEIGTDQLCEDIVKPTLWSRYRGYRWTHTGDPMGAQRDQSNSMNTAVRSIKRYLGGLWVPGPVREEARFEPLRAALRRSNQGHGVIQVDRAKAAAVWYALRGGWHYNIAHTGVISSSPKKDEHSHPGDAMSYGAARLFPIRALQVPLRGPAQAQYSPWSQTEGGPPTGPLGFERPGAKVPRGPGNGIGQ